MRVRVTYFLEVISSWCFWAEPAWAELKARYAGKAEFDWQIALMPPEAFPQTRAQAEWFYRRSGTIMRSAVMLNPGWLEPELGDYAMPNRVAEAAKDLGVTDDRVRLAINRAAVLHGRKVGRLDTAVAVAAEAVPLDTEALRRLAASPQVEQRVRASTAAFQTLQVSQRPAFLIENAIGDRAVFSGLVQAEPLAATLDAMLQDAEAYACWKAHFGDPPPA